ncbi:SulP family inorganic anion transporter, partial [bacterium]
LAFVMLLPWLLREIPMAALAGVLVVTGWRLVSLEHVRHLYHHYGAMPAVIWATTLVMVVATDLLTGVLTGLALSLVELLPHWRHARLQVESEREGDDVALRLRGRATFIRLPRLTKVLDAVPSGGRIRLDVTGLERLDHTCAEVLTDWLQRKRKAGARIELIGLTAAHDHPCHRRLFSAATA